MKLDMKGAKLNRYPSVCVYVCVCVCVCARAYLTMPCVDRCVPDTRVCDVMCVCVCVCV